MWLTTVAQERKKRFRVKTLFFKRLRFRSLKRQQVSQIIILKTAFKNKGPKARSDWQSQVDQ